MEKIYFKKMYIYKLHRNNEFDHKQGRPAVLLKYKTETSLVWWGTHKLEQLNEKPVMIKFNNVPTYFYSKGIEKIETKDLKGYWVNFNDYEPYFLSVNHQKQLVSKFASFTNQKDPYEKIALLELENQVLKEENEQLKREKEKFQEQLESEYELE